MTPQEQFTKTAKVAIARSTFDRSHGLKTTFDAGKLIPILVDEALPGDTFNLTTTVFGRLATPIKPIMDNIMLDVHYFSVPIRLVWNSWQKFNGEQEDPGDSTDFLMPIVTSSGAGYGEDSIYDYMGIPTKVGSLPVRADFFRAYNFIWNEWYRDENLQDSVLVRKTDSGDLNTDFQILPRGKRKDYFTSALPFAQKADPVTIPLGTVAPVEVISETGVPIVGTWRDKNTGANQTTQTVEIDASGFTITQPSGSNVYYDPTGTLQVDLASATAATVNAWRQAFQIQVMFEKDARGGTRYTEVIRSHFGVISPDARLQRPEYLGGFTTRLNINPIGNTSDTATADQGDLAGIGTYGNSGKGFVKSFTEHELIFGFISARADLNYQQGINRMWSRSTRFDFYWPSLANLGEQAILNKELLYNNDANDDLVFGYQERYSEYKFKPSQVTSSFRSNHSASLDVWHLAQDFASLPSLNFTFIEENPPIDRIIATPGEPQFLLDVFHNYICARPMPTYAVPISLTKL